MNLNYSTTVAEEALHGILSDAMAILESMPIAIIYN